MPGLEELSGSLLLEDPTEVRHDLAAAPAAQPVPQAAAEAPAAHRALLGIPHLPTATPAPDLAALPSPSASSSASHRPPGPDDSSAQRTVELPPMGPRQTLELEDPTRIMQEPQRLIAPLERVEALEPGVVPPPPLQMYEALQGYEASAEGLPVPSGIAGDGGIAADGGDAAMTAGTSGQTAPVQGDVEVNSLPPSRLVAATEAVKTALAELRASFAKGDGASDPRRKWFLFAIAAAGLVAGIALVALGFLLTRNKEESPGAVASDSASAAPAAPSAEMPATTQATPVVPVPAVVPAPTEVVASTAACTVAGGPRVVAPSAIVPAGIEVRAVGNDLALGFAPDEHLATALRLDAATLAATSKVDAQSSEAIRRVVPLASADGALSIAEDTDRSGDVLQGRRTVPADPPLEIGSAGGNLVWAHPNGAASGKLWPIDGDGSVEALRGASEPGATPLVTAIAFRHAGAIWLGAATGRDDLTPMGGLTQAAGSGVSVGSPAIAVSGGVVLAAWADKAAATDPWRLRWVTFKAGDAPGVPGTFTPPAGGRGEQAMSPGIASAPGGRFLLVWTEGPATRHDVRALTLSREGQPLGKPLVISNKGANAGQGQVAINTSGQGVVAFLESAGAGGSTEHGFKVVATPIKCAP